MSVYYLCNKFQCICYTLSNFDIANPANPVANPMVNRYVFSNDDITDMILNLVCKRKVRVRNYAGLNKNTRDTTD